MRTWTFEREDGSEALVTQYDTGEVTLAERAHTWDTWGPPCTGIAEEPYNYRTRGIEDILLQAGWTEAL